MKRNGGGWAKTKRRKESWRRHLTLGNICGMLFIVGVVVFIASILLILYNLRLVVGERNEQLWKDDVNKFVRDAKRADDTWIMIPSLMAANQILARHDYEPTLDEFIERAEEIENSWDSVIYRRGLYFLKQDLGEWSAPIRSSNHADEVIFWLGVFAVGFVIMWAGWKGVSMEDDC